MALFSLFALQSMMRMLYLYSNIFLQCNISSQLTSVENSVSGTQNSDTQAGTISADYPMSMRSKKVSDSSTSINTIKLGRMSHSLKEWIISEREYLSQSFCSSVLCNGFIHEFNFKDMFKSH